MYSLCSTKFASLYFLVHSTKFASSLFFYHDPLFVLFSSIYLTDLFILSHFDFHPLFLVCSPFACEANLAREVYSIMIGKFKLFLSIGSVNFSPKTTTQFKTVNNLFFEVIFTCFHNFQYFPYCCLNIVCPTKNFASTRLKVPNNKIVGCISLMIEQHYGPTTKVVLTKVE